LIVEVNAAKTLPHCEKSQNGFKGYWSSP